LIELQEEITDIMYTCLKNMVQQMTTVQ